MSYSEEQIGRFMEAALEEAEKAFLKGDVPVGCVIVWEGEIVSRAHNAREAEKNALLHAELSAIDKACRTLGGWRLHKGDAFVTLEPCIMCASALSQARIRTVYYGAPDIRAGGFGGITDIRDLPITHKPETVSGVMRERCEELLKRFFTELREKKAADKQ